MSSFGWCTWDAFYSRVSAEGECPVQCNVLSRSFGQQAVSLTRPLHAGISEGLEALKEGGVPPKLLIIDDGWQRTELDASLQPPPSEEEVLRAEQEVRGQIALSFQYVGSWELSSKLEVCLQM